MGVYERHPGICPDGNWVAFVWHGRHPSVESGVGSNIYVISTSGDTPSNLPVLMGSRAILTMPPGGWWYAHERVDQSGSDPRITDLVPY